VAQEIVELSRKAAVYVSWRTFKNAIEGLVQGIPNQIDRTAFPGLAWSVQNQLLAGFKFLGLIDEKLKPTPLLQALAAPEEGQRKVRLNAILHDRYADLLALDLSKTTPAQLDEQMTTSYNVSGATREKAVRFFISAASYVGVPMSPLLLKSSRAAGNGTQVRKRRAPTTAARKVVTLPTIADEPIGPSQGAKRTVTLKSGGTLTLVASVDLFSLNADDRQFVFGLIDKLAEYEGQNSQKEGGS
jgi:hypothetical protein